MWGTTAKLATSAVFTHTAQLSKVKLLILEQKTESPSNSGIDITKPAQTHSNKISQVRIFKISTKSKIQNFTKSESQTFSSSPEPKNRLSPMNGIFSQSPKLRNFSKSELKKFG
jgi:hypothetical protein